MTRMTTHFNNQKVVLSNQHAVAETDVGFYQYNSENTYLWKPCAPWEHAAALVLHQFSNLKAPETIQDLLNMTPLIGMFTALH